MVVNKTLQDVIELISTAEMENLTLPKFSQQLLDLEITDQKEDTPTKYERNEPILPFMNSELCYTIIEKWRCLVESQPNYKAVYEITFNIKDTNIKFYPGDTIGVLPQNSQEEVQFILKHLNLIGKADCSYTIHLQTEVKTKIPPHIPVKSTLRYVLTNCVDLRGIVKKQFLLELSKYTEDRREKNAIEYLCSKEGAATYSEFILTMRNTLIDILMTFKTCKPPIGVLFFHLPRLLPRPYSIINSMRKDPDVLKICFSVMNLDEKRKGLTTRWLENILLSDTKLENALSKLSIDKDIKSKVPIYLRKNLGFSLCHIEKPLLLICAGTGIAPFIGFLEERMTLKEQCPHLQCGPSWLIFGCRNPEVDSIFKEELDAFIGNGVLHKLSTTYSRIENGGVKYVQDCIKQEGESLVEFIKSGAAVYVCGDLKTMTTQVRYCLVECFSLYGQMSSLEAETYFKDMERNKQYFVDVWS